VPKHSKREVFATFLMLGLYGFGGPTAHFALFRRVLAEERGWVSAAAYDEYLALCQFLPGPGSSQMAAVLGWVRAGALGAVAAMTAFALPSVVLMAAAAFALPVLPEAAAQGVTAGLLAAVAAVVAGAVFSMLRSLAQRGWALVIAAGCAVTLFAAAQFGFVSFLVLQPAMIALGAVAGLIVLRRRVEAHSEPFVRPAKAAGGWAAAGLFTLLLIGLPLLDGTDRALALADSVYRAGALVFGGGHVVLPLLQAELTPDPVSQEVFLAGYGLAQALPGPLFSFAAYLGAAAGDTVALGVVLAVLAAIMIFLPGLLLVFAVLPIWSSLKTLPLAQGALGGAAAAAGGVLAYAFYDPVLTSLPVDWRVWTLALIAFLSLQLAKAPPPLVVAACAIAGAVLI
jgi:chromate transporter